MVLVSYDQEQHHSFRDFDDCEESRYLTLLVPLSTCTTLNDFYVSQISATVHAEHEPVKISMTTEQNFIMS